MTQRRVLRALLGVTVLLLVMPIAAQVTSQDEAIDWEKARELHRKARGGETLTPEEQAYYERAKAIRQKPARPQSGLKPGAKSGRRFPRPKLPDVAGKKSLGLEPLADMSADDRYKGQDGGLYGNSRNTPPEEHLKAALREAARIEPLDAEGRPSPEGKIVLISSGMSNTTQEFSAFVELAGRDAERSKHLVVVDCAFGGQDVADWAQPERRFRKDAKDPWDRQLEALKKAGVSPGQVQVAWLKHARRNPASIGPFPKHAEEMKQHLVVVLNRLRQRFPNLRLAYLSSRIYAGYAVTPLNPEPYAYESAFAVRWLIEDQIRGDAALNFDPERGEVNSPLLLWGPYLWADGTSGRKLDELVWHREDLARDGTHPSASGRRKVARQLLDFFKTDPTAKPWFVGR